MANGVEAGSGRDAVAEPLAPAATIDPDVARSLPKIETRPGLCPGPRGTIRRRHALQAWAPARSAPRATPARTLRSLLGSHLNSGAAEAEKVVVAVAGIEPEPVRG